MCLDAASWSERYLTGNTPWDHGAAHPELERLLEEGALTPPRRGARALVPGCGRGHDALSLAAAGWSVTAIDFAPEASEPVGPALASQGVDLLLEDALAHQPSASYDLLWEHTFFCAIDPGLRPAYGELARRTVAAGGTLAALLFPVGKGAETDGPPFGYGLADLVRALGEGFSLTHHGPAQCSIAARSWAEELAIFSRST